MDEPTNPNSYLVERFIRRFSPFKILILDLVEMDMSWIIVSSAEYDRHTDLPNGLDNDCTNAALTTVAGTLYGARRFHLLSGKKIGVRLSATPRQ